MISPNAHFPTRFERYCEFNRVQTTTYGGGPNHSSPAYNFIHPLVLNSIRAGLFFKE